MSKAKISSLDKASTNSKLSLKILLLNLHLEKLIAIEKILKILHKHLSGSDIKWCIIGKMNLILQGIDIKFSQIGVLIDYESIEGF